MVFPPKALRSPWKVIFHYSPPTRSSVYTFLEHNIRHDGTDKKGILALRLVFRVGYSWL